MSSYRFSLVALVLLLALRLCEFSCYGEPAALTNTNQTNSHCPPGTLFSLMSGKCAPVKDVRDTFPDLNNFSATHRLPDLRKLRNEHAAKRGLKGNGMPVPGGLGAGTDYLTGSLQALSHSELHTDMFVYPRGIDPSGQLSFLFTSATNRTEKTLEVLGVYSDYNAGSGVGYLDIFDWSCSADDPCQDGTTEPSYQLAKPFSDFQCNMADIADGAGHLHTNLYYDNMSEMLDNQTPPLWSNRAYLWNFCNNGWDLVYEHQFRVNQKDCSIDSSCGWWGPIFETFDNPEPEINELGYQNTVLYHDGKWSNLSPSETHFTIPGSPWTLNFLAPNQAFSAGNYLKNLGTYKFSGFFSPVKNPPASNPVKAGKAIAFKWNIKDSNGVVIIDPASFVSLMSYPVNCRTFSGNSANAVTESASGTPSLQGFGNGNWQLNWVPSAKYAGTCRITVLNLKDGSTHRANFKFQ